MNHQWTAPPANAIGGGSNLRDALLDEIKTLSTPAGGKPVAAG